MHLTTAKTSFQAVFALDVVTAGIALLFLGIATRPTLQRLKEHRFSIRDTSNDGRAPTNGGHNSSSSSINYNGDMGLHGRRPYTSSSTSNGYAVAALSFATALSTILFTTAINGAVWIHWSHVLNNGVRIGSPGTKSKLWNALILLAILGTGLAAWGRAMKISERPQLARFALIVVPLLWLRNFFMIYDIVLLYVDTTGWSTASRLATVFLLIVFGQITNLTILGMVLWGAWRIGRTVPLFGGSESGSRDKDKDSERGLNHGYY
ncbi:Uu.00g066820.m01.CDS01 [Anthostomella pinea]|uniref:Uu.00g066820.m01.CDS01 n=1 Tax=Anthostomella pinea TaxID=933095 RepID=A0AAI8YKX3_9PEZI|nr:Uu.00g066820.m01.CDS01 [Anthostomella pinea]